MGDGHVAIADGIKLVTNQACRIGHYVISYDIARTHVNSAGPGYIGMAKRDTFRGRGASWHWYGVACCVRTSTLYTRYIDHNPNKTLTHHVP